MTQPSLVDFEARSAQRMDALRRVRERQVVPPALVGAEDVFGPDHVAAKELEEPSSDDWKPETKKCFVKEREGIFRRKTRELYEARGYKVYDVGFWFSFWKEGQQVMHRSDLYGCFDMEAFKGLETVGIQFTSKENLGAHVTKMCSHKPASSRDATWRSVHMRDWLASGRRIELVGWSQPGGKGKPYMAEIRDFTNELMDTHEPRTRTKKA